MIEALVTFLKDILSFVFQEDYLSKKKTDKYLKNYIRTLICMGRIQEQLISFSKSIEKWISDDFKYFPYLDFDINTILYYLDELNKHSIDFREMEYIFDKEFEGVNISLHFKLKWGLFTLWKNIIELNRKNYFANGHADKKIFYIPDYSALSIWDENMANKLCSIYENLMYDGYDFIEYNNFSDLEFHCNKIKKIELPKDKEEIEKILECTKFALDELNIAIRDAKMIFNLFVGENKIDIIKYL